MDKKTFVLCGLAILGLGGCTPGQVAPATGLSPATKTIVIVPSLPDHLIVATRGFTVFGNHLDTPSIASWNLDGLVYAQAAAALSPRFSVSEAVPKDLLIDYQSRMVAALDNDNGVAELLKAEVAVTPAPDLYIVFCVSARSHPYVDAPGTPAFMQDIGVSHALPPWGLPDLPPVLHSFLEMTIIDGHTMKVIYDTPLLMPPGSNVVKGVLMTQDEPYPVKELRNFAWHNRWSDMTPAEQQEIKQGIEEMLTQAVGYTVQHAVAVPQA